VNAWLPPAGIETEDDGVGPNGTVRRTAPPVTLNVGVTDVTIDPPGFETVQTIRPSEPIGQAPGVKVNEHVKSPGEITLRPAATMLLVMPAPFPASVAVACALNVIEPPPVQENDQVNEADPPADSAPKTTGEAKIVTPPLPEKVRIGVTAVHPPIPASVTVRTIVPEAPSGRVVALTVEATIKLEDVGVGWAMNVVLFEFQVPELQPLDPATNAVLLTRTVA